MQHCFCSCTCISTMSIAYLVPPEPTHIWLAIYRNLMFTNILSILQSLIEKHPCVPHSVFHLQNPPEFQPGANQDITHYFISVGTMDSMTISSGVACPTSTCSHSYSTSISNSPLSVSMSAVNIIGSGKMCTPQTEIGMCSWTKSLINVSYVPLV